MQEQEHMLIQICKDTKWKDGDDHTLFLPYEMQILFVCKSKKKGGLGIKDIKKMNRSLLYFVNGGGSWNMRRAFGKT